MHFNGSISPFGIHDFKVLVRQIYCLGFMHLLNGDQGVADSDLRQVSGEDPFFDIFGIVCVYRCLLDRTLIRLLLNR